MVEKWAENWEYSMVDQLANQLAVKLDFLKADQLELQMVEHLVETMAANWELRTVAKMALPMVDLSA